ncbi:CCA tRNA nucleotidyltransferase [Lacticaseibacillus nasuensis]|nr:CCA tRNA nucleotidyltransferase [Lacticaseibacillus nasuensis]
MQIDLSAPDFARAIPILQQLEQAGYEAYFVGGSVRDALLHLPIHDVDIATSAYPAEVKQVFARTVDTGIQHGTVMVLLHGTGYEVTTFRTESGYQDFRRPDHVTFVRDLAEDLKRRDFTVNALALRHDGTVVDLFAGLSDLAEHRLRAVGDPHARFHEDALRMMRAVRFESQLGFHIEAATTAAIADNAALLAKISVERVASEFNRLLLGHWRQQGLASLIDTGLAEFAPRLAGQASALQAFAALPATPFASLEIGWTLLSHFLQQAPGPLLKAWKQPNALIAATQHAVTLLAAMPQPSDWQLYEAGEAAVVTATAAQTYLQPDFDAASVQTRYAQLPIHAAADLAINGGTLIQAGVQPGPKLGQTLQRLTQAVVAGELPNTQAALLAASRADPC